MSNVARKNFQKKLVSMVDRVDQKNYSLFDISDRDAEEKGRKRIVDDLQGLAPGLFQLHRSNVCLALGLFIHFKEMEEMCIKRLRSLNEIQSSGVQVAGINELEARYGEKLDILWFRINKAYKAASLEEQKAIKRCVEAHLVVASTPEGVRNHEIPRKYIYQVDGEWRLRPGAMEIVLTKEMLPPYDRKGAPDGFNLEKSLEGKSGKYAISTAGVRGRQNILFPWSGAEEINFFEEAVTAYSQGIALAVMASRQDSELQADIAELRRLIEKDRPQMEVYLGAVLGRGKKTKVEVTDAMILAEIMTIYPPAAKIFTRITSKLQKLAGGESRFNTRLYQELFVRIAAAMGYTVHTPLLDGENKISIWMASFLIFTKDFDGGNYITSSHARDNFACSKDLSDEGAQYLPDVSKAFAQVNEWVLSQIRQDGKFVIPVAAENHPNIIRDVDGVEEYAKLLESSVATAENLDLVRRAMAKGYKFIQDCVHGCMGPLMKKLFSRFGIDGAVVQMNTDYDPWQGGLGKAIVREKKLKPVLDSKYRKIAELPTVSLSDEGLDASKQVVVERMDYERTMANQPVGTIVSNTDPDGDRFVAGQILENSPEVKDALKRLGVKFIELPNGKLYCYFSPNKMFLMTTLFYAERLRLSGKIKEGDTVVVIKTVQTSFAFNQWAEEYSQKHGIKVVAIEPTVGFKEIAAVERQIEAGLKRNSELTAQGHPAQDIVITDALDHKINLGSGKVIMLSGSEESGGQELAPPEGVTSANGRFAIGNREKSAGVASFLMAVLGAYLYEEKLTLLEYWDKLVSDFNLTFVQDERHDEMLFDNSILDPQEFKLAKEQGNKRKLYNNRLLWNLARSAQAGLLTMDQVKQILKAFLQDPRALENLKPEERVLLDLSLIDGLTEIKPVVTAGAQPAKDGIYLIFMNNAAGKKFYLAVRPSGTDPAIKGYYSGEFDAKTGLAFAHLLASFTPDDTPSWQVTNFYEIDLYQ